MGNLASYNQRKSKSGNWQLQHNERLRKVDYLIDEPNVEVSLKFDEALALRDKFIEQGKNAYENAKKQKFQAKSYLWSAVVNIKKDTTMDDLQRFADKMKEDYGFNCYQIAIHRDEGHFDKGEKIHNHHAHLEFVTLDLETGINCQRKVRKAELSKIQSLCAETLGMQRGEKYYETAKKMKEIGVKYAKPSRIEPRGYARIKEQEKLDISQKKKLKATYNDLKAYYHANIKELQQKNAETQLFKDERAKFERLAEEIKARNKAENPMTKDELKAQYVKELEPKVEKVVENAKIATNNTPQPQSQVSALNKAHTQNTQGGENKTNQSGAVDKNKQATIAQGGENQTQSAAAEKESFKGNETNSGALGDELVSAFAKAVQSIFSAQYKTIAELIFQNAYQSNLKVEKAFEMAQKAEKGKLPYKISKDVISGKYALLICDKKENLDNFYKTFKAKAIARRKELMAKYPNSKDLQEPRYAEKTLKEVEKIMKNKGYTITKGK